MITEGETSLSDSALLNNSSIQHIYGSLGIFHTPPLPGADYNTPHARTPPSLNDDFLLHSHPTSPHLQGYRYASFNPNRHKRRESFTTSMSNIKFAMTPQPQPQQSAVSSSSSSSYSKSPLSSHTDYLKYNTNNKNHQPYHYPYQPQTPYFSNINMKNNNINHLYSNVLDRMSSIQSHSLFLSSPNNHHKNNINNYYSGFHLEKKQTSPKCPNIFAIMYIVHSFSGLAFLSQPYAIAHGGWLSIVAFMIVALISHHCCRIYVKCFWGHTDSFNYPSYPQLGWIISGSCTYYLILILSVCECVGIACVYIIFLWNNIYYLFSNIWSLSYISEKNDLLVVSFSIITIVPSILFFSVSNMYCLSYMTLIATIIMTFTLMFFIILHIICHQELAHYDLEHPIESYIYTNFSSFSISIGIFLFCFTGNSYSKLPFIQTTLKQPQFPSNILRRSFLLLFVMYAFIGICGYLLYGEFVHSIILRNIMHQCKEHGILCDLVCIFFVICTWGAISPLCVKISDFIESNVIYEWFRNKRKNQSTTQTQNYVKQNTIHHYQYQYQCEQSSIHSTSINSIDSINSLTYSQSQHQQHAQQQMATNCNKTDNSDDATLYITNTTKRICRLTVFIILLLISFMCRDHITFLESIVGICFTSMLCLIVPCCLYLKSFWNTLSCWNKFAHILLTIFVIIATISLLIGSIIDAITGKDAANKA